MTAWMRRSLNMLSLSKQQLEELVREQARNNPWLELAPPATQAADDLVATATDGLPAACLLSDRQAAARAGGFVVVPCPDVQVRLRPSVGEATTNGEQRQRWEAARALVRALEWREEVLLSVAQAVVEAQADFLSGRCDLPRRLRLCELARRLHLHQSTVGRVTRNKTILTSRGRLKLRSLVNDRTNAEALIDAIRAIIAAVGPRARLSDAEITQRLAEAGLTVARRTVSKHRRNASLAEGSSLQV